MASNTFTGLVYLASPYSDPDPSVMAARHADVCRCAGAIMSTGVLVFSPIAHTHPIAVACDLPRGWDFWDHYDRRMIAACDEVWVCMLPGWRESRGVRAEICIARQLDKPIRYVSGDGQEANP